MDNLFRSDPQWLGGDAAYSVDLGGGRILWLLGDSFVNTTGSGSRAEGKMVHNTIAIQNGYAPENATIKFYWGEKEGDPTSYFEDGADFWYWPGHGVRLPSGKLVVFLLKVRRTGSGSWDFESFATRALIVDNPDADPTAWNPRWVDVAEKPYGIAVASGGAVLSGEYLYAYGSRGTKSDAATVARWPLNEVEAGTLTNPEWHTGNGVWTRQNVLSGAPAVIFGEGQSEYTVHPDTFLGQFVAFQTAGFGAAELAYRTSSNLAEGWSGLQRCYRPAEAGRAGIYIYQGKAHPMLQGAEVPLSYSVNSFDANVQLTDMSLYYPRFLKGSWRR